MKDPIWIYGAAGHAKVIIQLIHAIDREVGGVVDDNEQIHGNRVMGFEIQPPSEFPVGATGIIAIGHNPTRRRIAESLEANWESLIHPTAIVDSTVQVGNGSVIMAGAIIQAEAVLGNQVIVNTRASVDHECQIKDFSHVCPGATLAGEVTLGELSMVGTGVSVIPGIQIGDSVIIGAGSAVIRDVPEAGTYAGSPARRI